MGVLSILEISKKQNYIFKSNRLKENIGASEIIRYVTEELSEDICNKNNGKLINAGGGQTIFYFENTEDSKKFAENLSFELLKKYPSLEFFISGIEYNPYTDQIIKKIKELHDKLENKKAERKQYSYIIEFGITQECDSTRLPAVGNDPEYGGFYSREVESKVGMFNSLKEKEEGKYAINFSDLGISRNEKSYIAITHIDGNRMGKKLEQLRAKYENSYTTENTKEQNEKYIKDLQYFSSQVKTAFEHAFQKVLDTLQSNFKYLKKDNGFNLKDGTFPIRKVILSGDDVCYITDARIAIDCAAVFLNELEKHTVMNEKLTACAGIAMVREKYPFFKAYELSEELCRQAKSSIPEGANESRIDWHIVQGEYNNNLNEIRNTSYKTYDGKDLLLRPLVVSKGSNAVNSYQNFRKDIQIINSKNVPRSKVKSMIKEMKKGEEHLDTYIEINHLYTLLGPHRIEKHKKEAKTGFIDGKCILFDAIETMDYYIPLFNEEE